MSIRRTIRWGTIIPGLLTLAMLGACNPDVSGPGAPALAPSFLIGPGETLWDLVNVNSTPNGLGGTCDAPSIGANGKCSYANSQTISDPGLGSVTFTATLVPLVTGTPRVVFQWFANQQAPDDEKGVGICRETANPADTPPATYPSKCYTGGEIGEGTETDQLIVNLTGLNPGVVVTQIRLGSLQTGETYRVAFCTGATVGTCGADVTGGAAADQGNIDLPVPAGTTYIRLKRNTGDYLLNAITTKNTSAGTQGCSPGYWKKHNFPSGYSKSALFTSVGFENAFPGKTLQQVLEAGGGGLTALGRITVGAYFNAVALGSNYGLTPAQVVSMFNGVFPGGDYEGLKNQLEAMQDDDEGLLTGRVCPNPTGK